MSSERHAGKSTDGCTERQTALSSGRHVDKSTDGYQKDRQT